MRKAAICLLLMLWSAATFAQEEPQWKVVKHVILRQQTDNVFETLLTPTEPGIYRLSAYFSGGGGGVGQEQFFALVLGGMDITGQSVGWAEDLFCDYKGATWMPPVMVSLKPGEPLTYRVQASRRLPTAGCQYNLAITVEQLM